MAREPEYLRDFERGSQAMDKGRFDDALVAFTASLQKEPTFTFAEASQAIALLGLEREEEARQIITRLEAEHPTDFSTLIGITGIYHSLGEPEKALSLLERAGGVAPEAPEAYMALVHGFADMGDVDRAFEWAQRAVRLAPESSEAHMLLGRLYVDKEQFQDAFDEFQRAVKLDPHNEEAQLSLGTAYLTQEQWDDAIVPLKKAIAIDPQYALAYVMLGNAYGRSDRTREALAAAKNAMKYADEDPDIYFEVARLYLGMGRLQDAKPLLKQLVEWDPEDTEAYMMLAGIAANVGDMTLAAEAIEAINRVDPGLFEELEERAGLDYTPPATGRQLKQSAKPAPESGPEDSIYQLKVTVHGSKPPIWRRVQVPGDFTLAKLHTIIQVLMEWSDSHLHEFQIGAVSYADPRAELENTRDERKVKLRAVAGEKSKFVYVYDFGDNWELDILVEKILPRQEGFHYPNCITGKLAPPLEDSGGLWGYYHMVEVLKDTNDPEYADFEEWAGGEIDPEAFDCLVLNRAFVKMKL